MSIFLKEFKRLSTQNQITNSKLTSHSFVNRFGTVFYPHSFRLAVKVISQHGKWLNCQALSTLEAYKVSQEHFYPLGHQFSMMMIDQQIEDYNLIPQKEREEAYNTSVLHPLNP